MISVNGESLDWSEGMTIQDILDRRNYTFRMLSVWVNDTPVHKERFQTTTVKDNAVVQVIHMISGG